MTPFRPVLLIAALAALLTACSGGGGTGGGAGGGTGGGTAGGAGGGTAGGAGGGTAGGAGGGTAGGAGGGAPSCPPPSDAGAPVYIAVVRGTLSLADGGAPGDAGYTAADLASARTRHNQIAQGGEASSRDAGDFAHDVLLGTTILDTTKDEFLAIDRWTDATSMQAFYANPQIAAAFGSLFSGAPTIEYFQAQPLWVNWGDMQSGDAFNPYFFHFALGTQSAATPAAGQAAHDQVACGGKAPSIGAGNVAHVVYTGLTNPKRFLGVDIWSASTNIDAFYKDPNFVAAFGQLFTEVKQPTFQSSDWYQW